MGRGWLEHISGICGIQIGIQEKSYEGTKRRLN
jgi:hypothetical protein